MSYGEEDHSGIPTRLIHEAYVEVIQSLNRYRAAKDAQNQRQLQRHHGDLQQSVLTLFDTLQSHLKEEPALQDWWKGRPPAYNGDGTPPDPDKGRGILQVQQTTRTVSITDLDTDPAELETLKDWHEALGLNGSIRLAGVTGMGESAFLTVQQYHMGLRNLKDWETKYTRKTKQKTGFMSDKTTETVERQRIPIDRLKRASYELADVANKLGLLSDVDAGGSEIIRGFDQSGEEPKASLDHAKYRGNPDL